MASYIKTLKEDNGDITYPQTLGSAVLLTGGADLETELSNKASASAVAGKIDIGDVQSSDITAGAVTTAKIDDEAVTLAKLDPSIGTYSLTEALTPYTWLDGSAVYKRTFRVNNVTQAQTTVTHGISNFGTLVNAEGVMYTSGQGYQPLNRVLPSLMSTWGWGLGDIQATTFTLFFGTGYTLSQITVWITLYYTKSS